VAPAAPDSAADALAGTRTGGARIDSSGRFEGRPGFRGSSAFDGSPARGWVAPWEPGRPAWLAWQTPRAVTLRGLTIERASVRSRYPVRVALEFPGGRTPPLVVRPGGHVSLPRPVRSRSFRLDVVAASGAAAAAAGGS